MNANYPMMIKLIEIIKIIGQFAGKMPEFFLVQNYDGMIKSTFLSFSEFHGFTKIF